MDRRVEDRPEHPAVERGRAPAALHPFHHPHVFSEDRGPSLPDGGPGGLEAGVLGRLVDEVAPPAFDGAVWGHRFQHHRPEVVPVAGHERVGIQARVLPRPGRPRLDPGQGGALVGDRVVRGGTLPREPRAVEEAVVVLEGRLSVEGGVDPRKVRRIEVVLDRELPVPLDVEAELAVGGGGMEAPFVARPPETLEALREGPDPGLERLRVAGEVDEHEVQPHPAPHRPEPVPGAIEAVRLVDPEASEVGGADQPAFEVVGPGVVRAPDPALHPAGLPDELVAAMRADVVEHAHRAARRADHEEGHAEEVHGAQVARPRHVRRVPEAGPGGREDPFELEPEEVGARVGAVGKPGRLLDGAFDRGGELGDGKVRGHRRSSSLQIGI